MLLYVRTFKVMYFFHAPYSGKQQDTNIDTSITENLKMTRDRRVPDLLPGKSPLDFSLHETCNSAYLIT